MIEALSLVPPPAVCQDAGPASVTALRSSWHLLSCAYNAWSLGLQVTETPGDVRVPHKLGWPPGHCPVL